MSLPAEMTVAQVQQPRDTEPGLQGLINLYRPRLGGLLVAVLYLLTSVVLYVGWQSSAERPLTAEYGVGYALGIAGGCMMLLLLFYPLRKHLRLMRNWGPVSYWFRLHMMFGVLGPVCILFHSSFSLGSLNSNIALFCMLAVASSGLVGRYLYARIHHGLYGRKATLDELNAHSTLLDKSLQAPLSEHPRMAARISEFETLARQSPQSIAASLVLMWSLGIRTWISYLSLWRSYARDLDRRKRRAHLRHIGARLQCIRKVAEFNFYTRLFSAWHVLHLPLFLMLIISGIVHVIAVHMY